MNNADGSVKKAPHKGRSGRRFNLLDALIILIVVAVIALVLRAYLPGGLFRLAESSDVTIIYTVEVTGVKRELAAGIAVGDKVTEKGTAVFLGNVSAEVEVTPFSQVRYDADSGEVVMDEYDELSTLLITVKSNAKSNSSSGYSIGGRRIAIGAEYALSLPGFEGTGSCISITEISGKGGS